MDRSSDQTPAWKKCVQDPVQKNGSATHWEFCLN